MFYLYLSPPPPGPNKHRPSDKGIGPSAPWAPVATGYRHLPGGVGAFPAWGRRHRRRTTPPCRKATTRQRL